MTAKEDHFQRAMTQGHSAAWDQLWEQAAVHYRQALEILPDQPKALTSLGLALYELQQYEEALKVYIQAARLSLDDPLPLEKIAQIFERLGNLQRSAQASLQAAENYMKHREVGKALENWKRVSRIQPDNLQAHSRLALVYERLEQKPEAVSEYLAVASLYQALKDNEKAARTVQHALAILPASIEAQEAAALLTANRSLPRPTRPRGGTAPLRMAQARQITATEEMEANQDPVAEARTRALTVLAGMLFEITEDEPDNASAARRGLSAIVRGNSATGTKQTDRSRVVLHLGQMVDLQARGQLEQAASELERAVESGLDHPAAFYNLGLLHSEHGKREIANRFLLKAISTPDFAIGAYLLLGQNHRAQGELQQASKDYLYALRLADAQVVPADQADDLRLLYDSLIEAQSIENDKATLERLCENISSLLSRDDWRYQLREARKQIPGSDQGGPAVPLAEVLTASRSSQIIDSITKLNVLINQGYLHSAMEEAYHAVQFAPRYLPLHTMMGDILLKQGRQADAIEKFNMVAKAYSVRGEAQRAVDLYRKVVALSTMNLNTRSHLIEQLVLLGKTDEALTEYMDFAEAYYNMADLEMVRKTYAEALRLAQQPKVNRSWRVKILHRMADIAMQSLDWRQAIRIYEQIRTVQPNDETARAHLVELNFRLGQEQQAVSELDNFIAYLMGKNEQEKATAFVASLVREYTDRPVVRRRLADLYQQEGRTQDAVDQLDAAGEALLHSGDREGAIQMVESILALKPEKIGSYERLLAQLKSEKE